MGPRINMLQLFTYFLCCASPVYVIICAPHKLCFGLPTQIFPFIISSSMRKNHSKMFIITSDHPIILTLFLTIAFFSYLFTNTLRLLTLSIYLSLFFLSFSLILYDTPHPYITMVHI